MDDCKCVNEEIRELIKTNPTSFIKIAKQFTLQYAKDHVLVPGYLREEQTTINIDIPMYLQQTIFKYYAL